MAEQDAIAQTNAKIMGAFSGANFNGIINAVGWIVFVVVAVGACVWFYFWWKNKKLYNKKITAFDIVGINFSPGLRDVAKTVKIGTGGFEILYLKKLKVWKIAYGGRVGRDTYYFFIMPDGYWYNGMLSANLYQIDKEKGLIPIVTTNPTMRSQYTSLEKQIDALHAQKRGFWEQYGSWILGIGFVLVAGVFLWLNYKEFVTVSGNFNTAIDKMGVLLDKLNNLAGNVQATQQSGLIPAK